MSDVRANSKAILKRFKKLAGSSTDPATITAGQADRYAQSEWPRLIVYVDDSCLNIDDNLVENASRPFAIGRKSWRFRATQDGATASANFYSLVFIARGHGHNEYAYLKHVVTHLPAAKADDEIAALLPWNPAKQILSPCCTCRQCQTLGSPIPYHPTVKR